MSRTAYPVYGSFAPGHGAALYGTGAGLRLLAARLRQHASTALRLDRAPDDAVEASVANEAMVVLRRVKAALEVTGGRVPMGRACPYARESG